VESTDSPDIAANLLAVVFTAVANVADGIFRILVVGIAVYVAYTPIKEKNLFSN